MSASPRRRTVSWLAAGATAVLLFVGAALPVPPRYRPELGPFGPDRWAHMVGHAALTRELGTALGDGGGRHTVALAVLLSTAHSVALELLQKRIPGRKFEWGDIVAGIVGSLVGVVLAGSRRRRSEARATRARR